MPPTADGAPLLKKHTGRNDSSVCIFTVQEKVGVLFGSYFFVRIKEDSLKTFDGWFGRRYFDRLIRPKLFTSCYTLSSSVKKWDKVAAPLFSSSIGVATQIFCHFLSIVAKNEPTSWFRGRGIGNFFPKFVICQFCVFSLVSKPVVQLHFYFFAFSG